MNPTISGTYDVQCGKNGKPVKAFVRHSDVGDLEAKIPSCSDRWHSIEWLQANGWCNWVKIEN